MLDGVMCKNRTEQNRILPFLKCMQGQRRICPQGVEQSSSHTTASVSIHRSSLFHLDPMGDPLRAAGPVLRTYSAAIPFKIILRVDAALGVGHKSR